MTRQSAIAGTYSTNTLPIQNIRADRGAARLKDAIALLSRKMKMPKKMSDFDRGVIVGIGLACSIIQNVSDQPRAISEAISACALNRRKMKAAGVEDYDLKILRPVFAELK